MNARRGAHKAVRPNRWTRCGHVDRSAARTIYRVVEHILLNNGSDRCIDNAHRIIGKIREGGIANRRGDAVDFDAVQRVTNDGIVDNRSGGSGE